MAVGILHLLVQCQVGKSDIQAERQQLIKFTVYCYSSGNMLSKIN